MSPIKSNDSKKLEKVSLPEDVQPEEVKQEEIKSQTEVKDIFVKI